MSGESSGSSSAVSSVRLSAGSAVGRASVAGMLGVGA